MKLCLIPLLTGSIANAQCSATFCRTLRIEDWWRMTGSNRRPPACKAGALPAELIPRSCRPIQTHTDPRRLRRHLRGFTRPEPPQTRMVGLDGFEPSTPALSRRCSNRLSYRPLRLSAFFAVFNFTADKRERSTCNT